MMASSWGLRLIKSVASYQLPVASKTSAILWQLATGNWQLFLLPIITHRSLLRHHFFEVGVFSHQHFAEDVVLPHLDRLQPHQFEQRQKHADQRRPRRYIAEYLLQANGAIFEGEPAVQVLDHLADGYGLFVHCQDWPVARPVEDLLEGLDQVDHISGKFGLGAFSVQELSDRRIAQHRVFNLLLLQEHLCRGFELFVLEQPVDEFVARVFQRVGGSERIAGQQHLRLDVNQHRSHVDELGGDVYVVFPYALDVGEVLRRDFGDGNVVDVDVLLADQVEQQVKRTFVDFAERDGERKIAGVVLRGPGGRHGRSRAAPRSRDWRLFRYGLRQICHFVKSFAGSEVERPFGITFGLSLGLSLRL